MTTPEWIDAAAVGRSLSPAAAAASLTEALLRGFDPATDTRRHRVAVPAGELLSMPSVVERAVGVKLVSVTPTNRARGVPLVQGVHVVLDPVTLGPLALLDAAALTELRTPAVSMAAVDPVLHDRHGPLSIVVIGAGPQAVGHLRAVDDQFRDSRTVAQVTQLHRHAPPRSTSHSPGLRVDHERLGTPRATAALAGADLVICATSAPSPLFDSAVLREDVVVVAVGSHRPEHRELDDALMLRSRVIVEDVDTALREAGEVVRAASLAGPGFAGALLPMADVVTGRQFPSDAAPVVFKSTGMAWEDTVVGAAVAEVVLGVRDIATTDGPCGA